MEKSSIDEIREKFDNSVEKFSNLDTGQTTAVDSPIFLEVLTETAKRLVPRAYSLLDIGCGAGNYTLKLLQKLPNLDCTLLDLSSKMLERAFERTSKETSGKIETIQGDIHVTPLPEERFDIVISGLALHHLREDEHWKSVFTRIYRSLKPGGAFLISDMIRQANEETESLMWERLGKYMEELGRGETVEWIYNTSVREDTPRTLYFLMQLMDECGFKEVDVLHKNILFAAICGRKMPC